MSEWSLVVECDAVSEICDSNRVRPVKKNNNNKDSTEIRKTIKDSEEFGIFYRNLLIIITRQLQSLVTVRELTSIETRQTVGLAIGWIDIVGFARPVI